MLSPLGNFATAFPIQKGRFTLFRTLWTPAYIVSIYRSIIENDKCILGGITFSSCIPRHVSTICQLSNAYYSCLSVAVLRAIT